MIGNRDNNDGQGEAYRRATSSVEDGGDVICNRPQDHASAEGGDRETEPGRRPHEARGSDASNACFGA